LGLIRKLRPGRVLNNYIFGNGWLARLAFRCPFHYDMPKLEVTMLRVAGDVVGRMIHRVVLIYGSIRRQPSGNYQGDCQIVTGDELNKQRDDARFRSCGLNSLRAHEQVSAQSTSLEPEKCFGFRKYYLPGKKGCVEGEGEDD
jgi:hypothetical protein